MEIKTSHPLIGTLANTNLIRKPHSINDVEEGNRNYPFAEVVLITEVWELNPGEYRLFRASYLRSTPMFSGKGGHIKYQGVYLRSVIALCCKGEPTFLINPEGYDYARYIGIRNNID